MWALHMPFKGFYRALIPSFPTKIPARNSGRCVLPSKQPATLREAAGGQGGVDCT